MKIRTSWWENLVIVALMALFLSLNGCGVGFYTAMTEAEYNAETGSWRYRSNKNQEAFEAKIVEYRGKQTLEVKTTATTPEAAIAAAMASMAKLVDTLNALASQLAATAKAGALSGS